jgi:hypothetical protein
VRRAARRSIHAQDNMAANMQRLLELRLVARGLLASTLLPPALFAATLSAVLFAGAPPASAADCYPHCDYNHYYGPYDFTYVQPGLHGYPSCNARGECSPNLIYSAIGLRRGRITVRLPRSPSSSSRTFQ